MLALTRKCGESIVITGPCTVTVLGFDRGQVRLAFEAPDETSIYRSELSEKSRKNLDSARLGLEDRISD